MIMLATDGVFDNVPDSLLLAEITEKVSEGCRCVCLHAANAHNVCFISDAVMQQLFLRVA